MDELVKKIIALRDLTKSLTAKPGSNSLVPAIKPPSPKPLSLPSKTGAAPTKLPGVAVPSGKDPKAMAAQLKNPRPKKPTMEILKTDKNGQWDIEKAEGGQLYRIHVDGQPVTHPMTLGQIQGAHGPVKHIESKPGHRVVPHTPVAKDDSGTMMPDGTC